MKKWCVNGICGWIYCSLSWVAHARPVEAFGSIEEAKSPVTASSPSSSQSSSGRKVASSTSGELSEVEKTWNQLKSKAESLWSNYFGEPSASPQVKEDPVSSSISSTQEPVTNKGGPVSNPVPTKPPSDLNVRAEALSQSLPTYSTQDKGFSPQEIQSAKEQLKQKDTIRILSPGRKGASQLPVAPGGAPAYNFYEVKKEKTKKGNVRTVKIKKKLIPLLDIGEEPSLSTQSLSELNFTVKFPDYTLAQALRPTNGYDRKLAAQWAKKRIMMLGPFDEKSLRKGLIQGYPVTREMVAKIDVSEKPEESLSELPVRHLTDDEQKMLATLIINRKGDRCALVIALLDDLAKKKVFSEEASFELGVCAQKLKLYSQAYVRLIKVIKAEEPGLATQAIGLLAADLPSEYEIELTQVLANLKNKSLIPSEHMDDVHYVQGKGYFKLKKYSLAVQHAQAVSEKSHRYINARYLLGISEYAAGKGKDSMKTLLALREWMDKKARGDKNVSSLMAINIARIYFNLGDYKNSLAEYKKIGKDHPVWLQGLVEQGWAQVLMGDNSGAIGNMHSLHSPYFKSVYKPESYVVRSIGYLNICQYGDAYKSLYRMEQEHLPWVKAMETYLSKNHSSKEYYDTVKNYLRSPSTENIDGLPYQVIREMARGPDFLGFQTAINEKVDEDERYGEIPKQLNRGVSEIRVRMGRAKARYQEKVNQLNQAKKDSSLKKNVNEWLAQKRSNFELVVGYNYQLKLLAESKKKLTSFQSTAASQLSREKGQLRVSAGRAVGQRLAEMQKEVKRYLENNELLRYEIFAGAGENIRYQVAGGETVEARRIPASVKPTKILNWEFDGEYWEDEIGNYRSQAQDNCPQKGKIGVSGAPGARVFNKESE